MKTVKTMRTAIEKRKTMETDIEVSVNLDGSGNADIATGIGFFDHMLTALSRYSMVDMRIRAKGDLDTGTHHTMEDVGIVLGNAIAKALGDKGGISRAGWFEFRYMMDDAIAEAIIDISGRGRLVFEDRNGKELKYSTEFIGSSEPALGFATEDVKEFFLAFASNMKANIAIRLSRTGNAHHEVEATFKAFGKALRMAMEYDGRAAGKAQSTKGMID